MAVFGMDNEGFEVTSDKSPHGLSLRLWGFWRNDTAMAFQKEMQTTLRAFNRGS